MPTNYASLGPATVTFDLSTSFKNELKESTEKVDRHVDQLEEDIEFFNQCRQNMEQQIAFLMNKINELEKNQVSMQGNLNWLNNRVTALEAMYDKMS